MPGERRTCILGMSELHREQGDLEAAAQDLLTSKELGEQVELPDWQYRWCIAQARLKETQGDLDGALDLLDEAERLYVRTPLPDVRPIAALKARVWVAQGRLAEALDWARERGLSVDDDLSYLREFEHITLARVLIAQYKSDRADRSIHEAVGLLERLLKAAEEGGRTGSVIEILVLQALAHEAQGNIPRAARLLWNVPWPWLSRRATSESLWMKVSRWLVCSTKPSLVGLHRTMFGGCWQHSPVAEPEQTDSSEIPSSTILNGLSL